MHFLERIFAIAAKEIVQLRRDRLTLGMVVGIPALQLVLFGYAINTDVRHLKAAVADQAGTGMSRELVAAVEASQVADIVATANTATDLEALLRRGKVSIGILIPPDYERRLASSDRPTAQLLVDATDPTILATTRGLTNLEISDPLRSSPTMAHRPPSRSAPTTTPNGDPRSTSFPDSSASSSP